MKNEQIFHRAYELASRLHANDTRKDKVTPYMVHVDAVIEGSERVAKRRWPKVDLSETIWLIKSVAALHDVVEDHPNEINEKDLTQELSTVIDENDSGYDVGDIMANITAIVTAVGMITKKPKGVETYDSYVRRVLSHEWARIVKIADLEHNMSDLTPGSMLDKYQLTHWLLTTAIT